MTADQDVGATKATRPPRPGVAALRRPGAWAGLAFAALTPALCLPPSAPDALFWGLVALATAGAVGWALSLPAQDA